MASAVEVSSRANASSAFRNKLLAISVVNRNSEDGNDLNPPLLIKDLTIRAILLASSPALSRLAVALEIAISKRRSLAVG